MVCLTDGSPSIKHDSKVSVPFNDCGCFGIRRPRELRLDQARLAGLDGKGRCFGNEAPELRSWRRDRGEVRRVYVPQPAFSAAVRNGHGCRADTAECESREWLGLRGKLRGDIRG
jgi:hypothetical protein